MLAPMGKRKSVRIVVASLTLCATALLTSCSAGSSVTSTPTPTTQPIGKASTIDEVRDAFIAAGGVCNWTQDDRVTVATASGVCSDSTVIMLLDDRSDREKMVSNLQSLKLADRDLTLLVGENWVINSPSAEDMQAELGGEWVSE